jgi:hypothetical protein
LAKFAKILICVLSISTITSFPIELKSESRSVSPAPEAGNMANFDAIVICRKTNYVTLESLQQFLNSLDILVPVLSYDPERMSDQNSEHSLLIEIREEASVGSFECGHGWPAVPSSSDLAIFKVEAVAAFERLTGSTPIPGIFVYSNKMSDNFRLAIIEKGFEGPDTLLFEKMLALPEGTCRRHPECYKLEENQ